MPKRDISNSDDVVDTRDVMERIDELESEIGDAPDADELAADQGGEDEFADERAELAALKSFADDVESYCNMRDGEALIRDDHFVKYAQELAEDTGMISRDVSWPYTCIDWDKAADELKHDYSSAEWDGVTYWFRCH